MVISKIHPDSPRPLAAGGLEIAPAVEVPRQALQQGDGRFRRQQAKHLRAANLRRYRPTVPTPGVREGLDLDKVVQLLRATGLAGFDRHLAKPAIGFIYAQRLGVEVQEVERWGHATTLGHNDALQPNAPAKLPGGRDKDHLRGLR